VDQETKGGRREALRILAGAVGLAVAAQALGLPGCATGPQAEPIEVPASEVPPGRRVRLVWADGPVEVIRTADGISARSLRCTHQGCEVRWQPADRSYHCPCHGGVYDAEGRVTKGPPLQPLRAVPVKLVGDQVVIGG
jgi:Rieske Fe-S protein